MHIGESFRKLIRTISITHHNPFLLPNPKIHINKQQRLVLSFPLLLDIILTKPFIVGFWRVRTFFLFPWRRPSLIHILLVLFIVLIVLRVVQLDFAKLVLGYDAHVGVTSFLPHVNLLSHESSFSQSVHSFVYVLCVDMGGTSEDVSILC